MNGNRAHMIDKHDAARRQLMDAVRLWLEGRDRLAVHTLVMAAFGILNPLAKKTLGAKYEEFMRGFLSEYGYKRFFGLANYLKHADRDPDASIREPTDEENEWRIGLCLSIFRMLNGYLTPEMGAFHLMSMMTYPEYFRIAPDPDPDIEAGARYGADWMRQDVEKRRVTVRAYLKSMREGVLDPNMNLRRKDGSDA